MSNIIDSIQVSGTVYQIQGSGGNPTVELTQAEYDALVSAGTVSQTTYYIITDAEAVDLDNYYTKSETSGATQISTALASKADTATTYTKTEVDNAITAATSTKQDTLVSGTNIKTINNESILGSGNIDIQGGGSTYQAGTNISITNDTINCTLPIKKIQGYSSVIIGDSRNTVQGDSNVAVGYKNSINAKSGSYIPAYCFVGGEYNNVINTDEAAFGKYNNSVQNTSVGGASGTTLFSVGNGTGNNARHNAFEIRQNGDIYCSDGTNDVKLQDTITATAANTTALGGLKLVKLTQQEYDALTTKDSNTLYIVTDS